MNVFRRNCEIPPSDSSSTSSVALSPSSTPAEAVGSPSNDDPSAQRKGKGNSRKFWRRDKRGHTDMTSDVATTLSNSESPVLQPDRSTSISQPLDNAQTMTTKGSPDNANIADTSSSGNKTANTNIILGIVQTICDALDVVPYVGMVAGLASTAIKVVEEVDTCKGEWDKSHYPMMSSLHSKSLRFAW
ncbi:hypothetical protein EDD18DRAFT_542544 [Armillaria luteobubalina]|uniref:Uncharacterized protein n=1 Tax=Armillaria luteobubalina TaxID=153913 RepID=A0AA39UPK0_9AGAR|nr:hypothetical protein EDD18DRAFT_542544 [Armillaria luteobubalina]